MAYHGVACDRDRSHSTHDGYSHLSPYGLNVASEMYRALSSSALFTPVSYVYLPDVVGDRKSLGDPPSVFHAHITMLDCHLSMLKCSD